MCCCGDDEPPAPRGKLKRRSDISGNGRRPTSSQPNGNPQMSTLPISGARPIVAPPKAPTRNSTGDSGTRSPEGMGHSPDIAIPRPPASRSPPIDSSYLASSRMSVMSDSSRRVGYIYPQPSNAFPGSQDYLFPTSSRPSSVSAESMASSSMTQRASTPSESSAATRVGGGGPRSVLATVDEQGVLAADSMSRTQYTHPPLGHMRSRSFGSPAPMASNVQPAYLPSRPLSMQYRNSAPAVPIAYSPPVAAHDEGKLSISIDFGTTFSGVAYGSSRIAHGVVQQILNWPGTNETFRKIPTCLLYDENGQVKAWGLDAKAAANIPGYYKCEWFKLFLEPHALRDPALADPRLPKIPPGKRPFDLIVDFLRCLWSYARDQITRDIGALADLNTADIWLTVPAAWDGKGSQMMREAAVEADLVGAAYAGDVNWKDRLHVITEPEAAAVHCVHLTDLHKLRVGQSFMICDAGGGTVDLAVYRVLGSLQRLEIAEVCARTGSTCGSIFLDLRFRELVGSLLQNHPVHLNLHSLTSFMDAFAMTDKLAYRGDVDDDNLFYFNCFENDNTYDPSIGLMNGELAIPGRVLRQRVFDPILYEVLNLLETQVLNAGTTIDALMLVGGFSGCEYLFNRVRQQFGSRIRVIARPDDTDTATCRGAARYGLAHLPLVSTVVAPKSYMIRVKATAEPQDQLNRPAYIERNGAGALVCKNRLQYLVRKGALLRKGQRVVTKFCKYSETPLDRTFVAGLFSSDSDKIIRYVDEGELIDLCRWTVDIASLPSFQKQAANQPRAGFFTDFEVGLEFDGAEVRGVLLYQGIECGRVTFDFL